jgi:hypothetical protein
VSLWLKLPKRNHYIALLIILVILLGSFLFIYRCNTNPPGFFVDESSIAYNAYTISQTGQDEFGNSWPLYFRAFGDYKNPVQIYLLALIFKFAGPSILVARLLCAIEGVLCVLLLGVFAFRLSRDSLVALLVMTTAFLTPWLFEVSRVVFEVALYPVVLVLFLLSVQRASSRTNWNWSDVLCLTSTLALLTYTYSIGRLLAPLFAVGLVIFLTRARLKALISTWLVYALSFIPILIFQRQHDGALTARFNMISYLKPENALSVNVLQFIKHYAANLDPRRLFWHGDPNIYQVAHIYGKPVMLFSTALLLIVGIVIVIRKHSTERWWLYVFYGIAVSVIPGALTVDYFHILRIVALPIFLLVLTVPAWEWLLALKARKFAIAAFLLLTLAQGLFFQINYHRAVNNPWRRHLFDSDYEARIFAVALKDGRKPIYLADALDTPYIQAYWYGTLRGRALKDFVRLKPEGIPPTGALVITTHEGCTQENVISQIDPYTLYTAPETRPLAPLPNNAFRAEITVLESPATVHVGERIELGVLVKNVSEVSWPGCQRGPKKYQVYLGSHWVNALNQSWAKDEPRAPLPHVLAPGESATIKFLLNAPPVPGEYTLELDMVQEQVTWFATHGSATRPVTVIVK